MSSFVEPNKPTRYANDKPSFRKTTLDIVQDKFGIKDIAMKREAMQKNAIYSRKKPSLGLQDGGIVLRPHLRQACVTSIVTPKTNRAETHQGQRSRKHAETVMHSSLLKSSND